MRHENDTSRRDFLQTVAIAAAATTHCAPTRLFAAGGLADSSRYKKAVKIGMVGIQGSLVEKFRLLKRLGFDGVELDSPNNLDADHVRRARDEADFVIHGVVDSTHWKTTFSHPNDKVRAQAVDDLKTAIRDSRAYGGTSVLVVPAVVNKDVTYQQAWDRSQAAIRRAIPLASDLGIRILFENVWNEFLTDPNETAKYIDQFDSEVVGAYFDIGNAVRYAAPADWIRTLGKRIVKLDIKEFSLEKVKETGNQHDGFNVKLLDGSCNWPAVLDALRGIDFQGWGTAEIPGGGEDRLREIAERMDRIFAG